MALIPLELPPGIFRNGTDYLQSNKWRDSNLVRWIGTAVRPVGGWSVRQNLTPGAGSAPVVLPQTPRALIAWTDNSGDARIVAGSYGKLFSINEIGDITDITPIGLNVGELDATENIAYSGGFFGTGYYGVTRPYTGIVIEATTWSLDTWGEYLVACSNHDGKLYEWQLVGTTPAQQIANAPIDNVGLVVTEERFLMALGAGNNPRKIAWCDREDNTSWTPSVTNEAGDFELQIAGEIMCGVRVRGRTLILTSTDAHTATYQGPPYVYGFERVGSACGVVSRKAVAAVDAAAYWMGDEKFHVFDGSLARELPCDVSDFVFEDLNGNQRSKVAAVHNSEYNEVWWFYPSSESKENDSYVYYNYVENHWGIGRLARTAAVNQGVFANPIYCAPDGALYDHERHGFTHGGDYPFVESAPISLANGDQVMRLTKLIPDENTRGHVDLTFKTRFHPNDTEREYGPYDTANPTSIRLTGRQVRMRITATDSTDWRVGIMRVDATPGGKR